MGGAALAGLVALFAIGFLAAGSVVEATRAGEALRKDSQQIGDLQLESVELVLTAMDIIVDKDDGSVAPERAKLLSSSVSKLEQNASLIAATAKAMGKPALAQEYATAIAQLKRVAAKSAESGTPWEFQGDVGFTFAISSRAALDLGINVGLNKAAPDMNPFVGFSVKF